MNVALVRLKKYPIPRGKKPQMHADKTVVHLDKNCCQSGNGLLGLICLQPEEEILYRRKIVEGFTKCFSMS